MLRNSFLPLKRRWPMTTSKIKDTRILESLLCRGQRWAGNKPGFFSHSPHTLFHTTRTKRKLTYPKLGHWIEKRIVLLLKLPNKCDALGLYRSFSLVASFNSMQWRTVVSDGPARLPKTWQKQTQIFVGERDLRFQEILVATIPR